MSNLISLFVKETGLNENDVRRIISNAPLRYKTYTIPKRRGGRRSISQPAKELKVLQRVLVEKFLSDLPIHRAATAYHQGASIKHNAERHKANGPIMKFDFKDFFPSIRARDWRLYCIKNNIFPSLEDLEISIKILFRKEKGCPHLHLAIGAPSSPILSNILMFDFDKAVSELVAEDHVEYTRYADDLTFSAKRTGFLRSVEKNLKKVVRKIISPSLRINEEKTVAATKKYKRTVTGLVLTNDGSVSLGHERKKLIRATVHHALTGRLSCEQERKLAGWLAFVCDVEPEFLARLEAKYGKDSLQKLKQFS